MGKLKLTVLFGLIFLLTLGLTIHTIRKPSYTIKTNGKLYIVNKLSSSITVFDLLSGEEIVELQVHVEPHELTTLFDQNKVVVSNYGKGSVNGRHISVISTKSNEIVKTIELGGSLKPHGIISFPESNKVGIVADMSNDLLVVNIESGDIEKRISTQQQFSHLLVLHPKRSLAYVANINSNSVSVVDLGLNQVIKIIPCGLGTEGIDITPDGSEVWVTNSRQNTINIIETNNHQIIETLTAGNEPSRLKFSIDGNYCLVSNAKDGTVSVYNRNTKKLIKTITIRGKKNLLEKILYSTPRPVGIIMHPNGRYTFVANSNADKVEVIDMQSLSIVSTIGTGRVPDGMAFVE